MSNLLNLVKYFLIKDIKARYAGSSLGVLWTILLPVIQIALFWFVFSTIMKARPYANTQIPFIYFLLSSFFFWLAFSEGLIRASNSIIDNSEMVKKVAFPKAVLPMTVTLSSYAHHLVGFILFITVYSATVSFSTAVLLVMPVLLLQIVFSLGLGMFFSALLPYLRDIGQMLAQALQGMFFLSPILYSLEAVPEKFRILFYLNPMTYFATSYQAIILSETIPPLPTLLIILLLSSTAFAGGLYTFRKLKDGFADVL